jgi:hypothetical protein
VSRRGFPHDSYLDTKYFIDGDVYNCPFCKRRNVQYEVLGEFDFDWTPDKRCYVMIVKCSSCKNRSLHLSYEARAEFWEGMENWQIRSEMKDRLDDVNFYSVPTSYFVLDPNIPKVVRELVTEAEGCLKMNFLTGASACTRKAIYELLVKEEVEGEDYESRIKALKQKHPNVNPGYFDVLARIQGMTSDKVHEQSWDKWDSGSLKLILESLKAAVHEMYVVPAEHKLRFAKIEALARDFVGRKKGEAIAAEPKASEEP